MATLDTIRVLVEEGQIDPMAIDESGGTALHYYSGPVEGFEYLLYQDQFLVDLKHRSIFFGTKKTAAMRLIWSSEFINPIIVIRAIEEEILVEKQTNSRHRSPYTGAFLGHEDEMLTELFLHFSPSDERTPNFAAILKSIISCGADPHSIPPSWMFKSFIPLKDMPDPLRNSDSANELIKSKKQDRLRLWLRVLRDAGVDIEAYLTEEKALAAQRKDEWWPWRWSNDTTSGTERWYRAEIYGDSPEDCYFVVEWNVEDIETTEEGQITDVTLPKPTIPGGWVEEEEEDSGEERYEED